MSSVEEKPPSEGPAKTRIHDLRNAELVSRLLAATPPYLYSALPLQPHAFFFSEMLRSFVNARHGCRPPHYHRRFKRRSHKYFAENETGTWQRHWPKPEEEKKNPEPLRPEVPLELTVDKQQKIRDDDLRGLSPKIEPLKSNGSPGPPGRPPSFVDVGTEEIAKPAPCLPSEAEVPASNLILPPPPPMWYPPIYNPQFGMDPMNFFIDLRVSGHIYDRKRMGEEPMNQDVKVDDGVDKPSERVISQRPRHLSAFSVPVRSSMPSESHGNYYESAATATDFQAGKPNNTSYIMKNLRQVYDNLKSDDGKEQNEDGDVKTDSSDINDEDIVD